MGSLGIFGGLVRILSILTCVLIAVHAGSPPAFADTIDKPAPPAPIAALPVVMASPWVAAAGATDSRYGDWSRAR